MKNKLDSSFGHQNILATTPGHQQNLNSVAMVHGGAPPLSSHYPIITSCSPGKRGEKIVCCLDTSNRTSALVPIHMGSVHCPKRMLTSFTNAAGSAVAGTRQQGILPLEGVAQPFIDTGDDRYHQ